MNKLFFVLILLTILGCATYNKERACDSYKASKLKLGIWDMRCR